MVTDDERDGDRIGSLALMRAEARQLRQAIASHIVVDQAIGVVIVLGRLAPEQGWNVLKDVSQHTDTKLREVAGQVVAWANGGQLSASVRHALDSALTRCHQVS
ncbi:ANTAR domain-containing protein [Streptomyces sp. NPDC049813]|uniref:ANTAR domain-containing protein n=1 Tax=Streptomyces sp. NPDC049813 TaxID=3365597 RepID=UPI00378F9FC9